jgi:DNA-binding CsgD family transcriptional regulator
LFPNLRFRRGRSRSASPAPAVEDQWFVTDEPIKDSEHDRFHHVDVAELLGEVVLASDPPGVVGLLGAFGTGKSSVGELLVEQMRDHRNLVVVRVSADKHTGIGWQRAFTYDLSDKLVTTRALDERDRLDILQPLSSSRQQTALARIGAWVLAAAAAIYLTVVAAVTVGPHSINPWMWPLTPPWSTLGLAGILLTILTLFKLTDTTPRFEAADEIERVFRDLVDRCSGRLVLVVDDIDRLPPSQVLEATTTISTLKKKREQTTPVIVVACDEDVLRRALADADPGLSPVGGSAERAAAEYLDKLFTVRIYMPPHLQVNMRNYARELVSLRRSSGQAQGDAQVNEALGVALDILIHREVRTPRHVIRLLNAFFADLRLAERRERENKGMAAKEVTEHPTVLARLTVLRVDFPYIYERIAQDLTLLDALDGFAKGTLGDASRRAQLAGLFRALAPQPTLSNADDAAVAVDDRTGDLVVPAELRPLIGFLQATVDRITRPGALEPFFYLGQPPHEVILTGRVAQEIRHALRGGESGVVRTHLLAGDNDPRWAGAVAITIAEGIGTTANDVELAKSIQAASEVLDALPLEQREHIASELVTRIVRTPAVTPAPGGLLSMIKLIKPSPKREQLVQRLLTLDEDVGSLSTRAHAIYGLALMDGIEDRYRDALKLCFRGLVSTDNADQRDWLVDDLLLDADLPVTLAPEIDQWIDEALVHPTSTWDEVLGEEFYAFLLVLLSRTAAADGLPNVLRRGLGLARLVRSSDLARQSGRLRRMVQTLLSSGRSEPPVLFCATKLLHYMGPADDETPGFAERFASVMLDMETKALLETRVEAGQLLGAWRERHASMAGEDAGREHDGESRVQDLLDHVASEKSKLRAAVAAYLNATEPDGTGDQTTPADAVALTGLVVGPAIDTNSDDETTYLGAVVLAQLLVGPVDQHARGASSSVKLNQLLAAFDRLDEAMAMRILAQLVQLLDHAADEDIQTVEALLRALPGALESKVGGNEVRRLAQGWRNNLLQVQRSPVQLLTLVRALQTAYIAAPDMREMQMVWERLRELIDNPVNEVATVALRGLAAIVWPAPVDVEALSQVLGRWDLLDEPVRAAIVRDIATSERRVNDLPDRMRAVLIDYLLLGDQRLTQVVATLLDETERPTVRPADRGDLSEELTFLWPILQPDQRGRAFAMYHTTSPAAADLAAAATADEILAWVQATGPQVDTDALTTLLAERISSLTQRNAASFLIDIAESARPVPDGLVRHAVARLDGAEADRVYRAVNEEITSWYNPAADLYLIPGSDGNRRLPDPEPNEIVVLRALNRRFAAQVPSDLVRLLAHLLRESPWLAPLLGEAMRGVRDDSGQIARALEVIDRSSGEQFARAWKGSPRETRGSGTSEAPLLTPRELQIAKLASQGMHNREIGERLGIAARTVDNHLRQAYRKLGIGSRGDLGRFFDREPAPQHTWEARPTPATMDRAEAVRLLPEKYARALLLRDQGYEEAEIAAALGIVPEAIGTLLRLAEAKLQQLLDNPSELDEQLLVPLEG